MNYENLGISENSYVLLHVVDALAVGALVAAILHFLFGCEGFEALVNVNVASVAYCLARYLHGEVHEIVEGVAFMVTFLALDLTAQLTFE